MNIPVVTLGQPRGDLVGGLERLHGPITVVRRCSELTELIAACQSGLARAAVIADGTNDLTASLAERLFASGAAVVALTDDGAEAERLESFGVVVVGMTLESAALAECIFDAVATFRLHYKTSWSGSGLSHTSVFPSAQEARASEGPPQGMDGASSGLADGGSPACEVIAVWGPTGAPGRTLLAVNLASELASTGQKVLLIDSDTYGASVAAVLGLTDESAGIAQACRLADQGLFDASALQKTCVDIGLGPGTLSVLTGITRPDRWPELRPVALGIIVGCARQEFDALVVDAGFCLETDEELSFDSAAPRRNAATLRILELADTIFAVGGADPLGVPRLVRGLSELRARLPGAKIQVVLNRVRVSVVGRDPKRQIQDAWLRYGPQDRIAAFLPSDTQATDDALKRGSLLLEIAPNSELRLAIRNLVCAPTQQKRRTSVLSATAHVWRNT
ncbi:P-loop NTPase [Pseudarthrobacter sp. PS3-L1]|uniref:AAA family ATPase n=1 Tax=Pseudarthrobacter sp. PS3-L1 TaxID=3046207 RepID=UPI0024BA30A2|nr:P-loop NTPase [Pseudarthrobacter sp. PS3-L1]MDJ0321489.1 P-loop NTPase [Pseudarthrobacter sp. PS3-L1]